MKTTPYFEQKLLDRPEIRREWCEPVDEDGGIVGLEIDLASAKVDWKSLDLKGLLIPELLSK